MPAQTETEPRPIESLSREERVRGGPKYSTGFVAVDQVQRWRTGSWPRNRFDVRLKSKQWTKPRKTLFRRAIRPRTKAEAFSSTEKSARDQTESRSKNRSTTGRYPPWK